MEYTLGFWGFGVFISIFTSFPIKLLPCFFFYYIPNVNFIWSQYIPSKFEIICIVLSKNLYIDNKNIVISILSNIPRFMLHTIIIKT